MTDTSFRITVVTTAVLCARLDCAATVDSLDDALADAGYLRLDHGLVPEADVVIMPADRPAGRDPGHRGPALRIAHAMAHVVHADGMPETDRIRRAAETALELMPTDEVGRRIVQAAAAYHARNDPGLVMLSVGGVHDPDVERQAAAFHAVARNRGVVTDVALERAFDVGARVAGWRAAVMSNMRPEEPVMRVRRHDASDYEMRGIEPQLAELIAVLRSDPDINREEYCRHAKMIGLDPMDAAGRITAVLTDLTLLPAPQTPVENGGPSSVS